MPAAFGLVSFLLHEGFERNRIRKHLLVFALAAPVLAVFTYVILSQVRMIICMIYFNVYWVIINLTCNTDVETKFPG